MHVHPAVLARLTEQAFWRDSASTVACCSTVTCVAGFVAEGDSFMKRRFVAALALVAAGVAGCSSPPAALGTRDAKVIINGEATNALQPVVCSQTGQSWTIETLNKEPGFTATIKLGDTVTAETVDIRNLGNFTGTYWNDNLGKASAKVNQGKFTVSGEAEGAFADKPNQSTTATFDISTTC